MPTALTSLSSSYWLSGVQTVIHVTSEPMVQRNPNWPHHPQGESIVKENRATPTPTSTPTLGEESACVLSGTFPKLLRS